jgi:hypothetical protein
MAENDLTKPNIGSPLAGGFKKNLPKLIFLVLGIAAIIQIGFLVKSFREAPPPPQKLDARPVGKAQLHLVSEKSQYQVGETMVAQINVDSGGQPTNGTDVILKYDPAVFEATTGAIKAGPIYDDFPVLDFDRQTGTIRVSGIAGVASKGFNGVGVLATLNLKTLKSGTGEINFEFKDGSTTDSNVINLKTAEDILGKVTNLKVNVK